MKNSSTCEFKFQLKARFKHKYTHTHVGTYMASRKSFCMNNQKKRKYIKKNTKKSVNAKTLEKKNEAIRRN